MVNRQFIRKKTNNNDYKQTIICTIMKYKLLTVLLWPILFIYTTKISLRDKSWRYLLQRLGFAYPKQSKQHIWVHCASVGEVNTYFPLHIQLIKTFPDIQFVITTNTVTGADTVEKNIQQNNLKQTRHCYLPIESSFAINRFLRTWRPSQCIIMETEIWPLLYQLCHNKKIKISIINGRLSHRTLNAKPWIKSLYKTSLSFVDNILCKSQNEIEHFIELGATSSQTKLAGNLKFTSFEKNTNKKSIQLNNQTFCVAASTHDDEELQLATLWKKLSIDLLLVIVPRHPNRSEKIQKQFDTLAINYAVRSKKQTLLNDTKIYLADTLGELTQFMQNAEFVFIGGSLVKHGGQNILEPSRLGKATICGPHMFNFKEETQFLLDNHACIQIHELAELEKIVLNYIKNPLQLLTIGNNAKQSLKQQSSILNTYLSLLSES